VLNLLYDYLYNKFSSYNDFYTFGFVCFVNLLFNKRYKLFAQSVKYVFLVIIFLIKVLFAMIWIVTKFIFFKKLFSLKINISSLLMLNFPLLIKFFLLLRICYLLNYQRYRLTLLNFFSRLLHHLRILLKLFLRFFKWVYFLVLHKSILSSHSFDIFATVSIINIPSYYSQVFKYEQGKRNFRLFRIIIHEKLFLVL
jgi:hypothetical protein